ncbi:MAG: DUF3847 domain-containing protein, partial [Firmicutes bacterium]|nr:DUF3847 domain-containing protein [Bacillota bacterium]
MARKPVSERLDKVLADLENLEKEKKQLINEQKEEVRKMRTHRLCKRGGLVEKLLPDIIAFTDEQFDLFVDNTLLIADTKRIIAEIKSGQLKPPAVPKDDTPAHDGDGFLPKSTEAAE